MLRKFRRSVVLAPALLSAAVIGLGTGSALGKGGVGFGLNLGAVLRSFRVELSGLFEELGQLFRRCVDAASDEFRVSVQDRHRRKTALVVAVRDIRSLVNVDPHRNEPGVDQTNNPRIRVGGLVQHVAPMTPGGREGQQNRLLLTPRVLEGRFVPLSPINHRRKLSGYCSEP